MDIKKVNEILHEVIFTTGKLDTSSALTSLAQALQHIAESVAKIETELSSTKHQQK